ncbi:MULTISPECIES: COX15/CtaA family protein [Bacillus]|uniref:COX15/CtaA family protein n=1 Tax=Bacillus TaxID=1386 RepID=UPI0002F0AF2D|nr:MULTISPECIES: heme A synthase [Bacillus]
MHQGLKWFAVFTTIGMLFILIGGALVTKTDSGMGCGNSWPLCEGEIIPSEITPELIIELSHRIVSATVGIMVLVLSYWSWKSIGHIRETKFLSILSFSFLVIQGLIGAAAVKWGQSDFVLALHFGISLISFAAVLLLTLLIFEVDKKFEAEKLVIDQRMTFHTVGLILYVYFVVYSGALVRHTKASLVCPDWPLCRNNEFFLPNNLYEWVQMGHRALAGLAFIWIAYTTYIAVKHYSHQKVVYYGWLVAFFLVTLQVISGGMIIITRLNLFVALAHALFVSCLFGVLSYLLLLASRSKRNAFYVNTPPTNTKQL